MALAAGGAVAGRGRRSRRSAGCGRPARAATDPEGARPRREPRGGPRRDEPADRGSAHEGARGATARPRCRRAGRVAGDRADHGGADCGRGPRPGSPAADRRSCRLRGNGAASRRRRARPRDAGGAGAARAGRARHRRARQPLDRTARRRGARQPRPRPARRAGAWERVLRPADRPDPGQRGAVAAGRAHCAQPGGDRCDQRRQRDARGGRRRSGPPAHDRCRRACRASRTPAAPQAPEIMSVTAAPVPATAGLPYAGLVTRAVAFVLDLLILNGVLIAGGVVVGLVIEAFGTFAPHLNLGSAALAAAIWTLVFAAYFITSWSLTGQTPGMRAMGVKVVPTEGGRLRPRRGLVRVVGMGLAALPFFAGYLLILVSNRRQ